MLLLKLDKAFVIDICFFVLATRCHLVISSSKMDKIKAILAEK